MITEAGFGVKSTELRELFARLMRVPRSEVFSP